MEDSEKSQALPQLLDLIPDGREWKARDAQGPGRSRNTGFGSEEDKKLELKLGLPGLVEEEIKAVSRDEGLQQESPALSLGYFPKPSKAVPSMTTTGTKRGFLDTVEPKTEGRNEQKQQLRARCGDELALEEKIAAASERNKGCCTPPSSHAPTTPSVRNGGKRPQAQGRRNLAANSSSSKQPPEPQNGKTSTKAKLTCKKSPLVKINMDGIPIGRKVDLAACDSYERLSVAVKELFHGFLEAQKDASSAESAQNRADEKIFSQLLDGSGEYTLVYEDNEGDNMLVGDVPWKLERLQEEQIAKRAANFQSLRMS
ncbi:hypothetical protein EJB05_17035 [Eragrostis curvula]|uniref:Auxin-responsive protein n=1 Tax=Eragrostis curvula TaxID=38414 RepID=A0A5J9VG75_9POAL|nr:hypothetical protein EJB05_17035 [Eragrostis curvula]